MIRKSGTGFSEKIMLHTKAVLNNYEDRGFGLLEIGKHHGR
jgi:hypothetical protein